jgi:hypothetical protein
MMHPKLFHNVKKIMPLRRGLVVSFPPATEETGAMGLEIESPRGYRVVVFLNKKDCHGGWQSLMFLLKT